MSQTSQQESLPTLKPGSDITDQAVSRVELISALFLDFAGGTADPEESIPHYLKQTSDLPQYWLTRALDSFRNDRDRVFIPTISEIRTRVADRFLKAVCELRGIDGPTPPSKSERPVEAILSRLKRQAPQGLDQLRQIEAGRERPLEIEAGDEVWRKGPLVKFLDGVEVVDGDGEVSAVVDLARSLVERGIQVHGSGVDSGRAFRARTLARALACRMLEQEADWPGLTRARWDQYDADMVDLASVTGSDTSWWFDAEDGERRRSWKTLG